MQIEAGKYYKTRNGRKVGPMTLDEDDSVYPYYADLDGQPRWFTKNGVWSLAAESERDLIAEWAETPQGPVRTKTVTEIVPGVYGNLVVEGGGEGSGGFVRISLVRSAWNATELRAAALVLTQLAEALEE